MRNNTIPAVRTVVELGLACGVVVRVQGPGRTGDALSAAGAKLPGDPNHLAARAFRPAHSEALTERVFPGLVWMALHFAEQKVNWLTHDVGDPLGRERMLHAPADSLDVDAPYLDEKDVAFYHDPPASSSVLVLPGQFAIFFPADGHKPGCMAGGREAVRKVVVKVRIAG